MGHTRPKPQRSAVSPIRTLFVAWVIVVGLAFAPAATYVKLTGDDRLAYAGLAAAGMIGGALLMALGLAKIGGRAHVRVEDDGQIADLTRRGAVFGRR